MTYSELDRILNTSDFSGPASELTIIQAEQELGVKFPPSFRYYLEKFGASVGEGWQLSGLFFYPDESEPPFWLDVLRYTKEMRDDLGTHISDACIYISNDGSEDTYYIDTAIKDCNGESPVFVWGPGVEGKKIAESFEDLVIKMATNKLDYWK